MNLQGRGFAGFQKRLMVDSRTTLQYDEFFARSFPYTGMNFQHEVYTGAFDAKNATGTPANTALDGTANNQRYFTYFSNWTTTAREVGSTENGTLITTAVTAYDPPDSYGNFPKVTTTTTDNDPASPYLNDSWTTVTTNTWSEDAAHWCLSLLSQTQVA